MDYIFAVRENFGEDIMRNGKQTDRINLERRKESYALMETWYNLGKASDSLVGTLNLADGDNYPNRQKLLETASISPTGSTEEERAASGATMTSEWQDNLNLIQLQSLIQVDVLKVADILMRNGNRRMEQNLPTNNFSTKYNKPNESSIRKYLTKKPFF